MEALESSLSSGYSNCLHDIKCWLKKEIDSQKVKYDSLANFKIGPSKNTFVREKAQFYLYHLGILSEMLQTVEEWEKHK